MDFIFKTRFLVIFLGLLMIGHTELLAIPASTNIQSFVPAKKIMPTLSKGKKTVGDIFTYQYELPALPVVPSINLSFADPSKNKDVVVITQSITTPKNSCIFQATLVAFKTGRILFPTANILNYTVLPVTVTIDSVIPTTANIRLQKDFLPYQDYSDWILIFLVLMICLIGAVIAVKYKKKYQFAKKILSPRQKHALWKEACDYFTLNQRPENIKEYYAKASELLKNILKMESEIDLLDLTCEEIRNLLKIHQVNEYGRLLDCLDESDLVKYAKLTPDTPAFLAFEQKAVQFLKAHEPKPDEVAA